MGNVDIMLAGERLNALGSGALWWPATGTLVVGDLHLGRGGRQARGRGPLLPPYETAETLERLGAEIAQHAPRLVICLGDSFDDDAAAQAEGPMVAEALGRLARGVAWVWVAGNHDPGPVAGLPGIWREAVALGPIAFRHVAAPEAPAPGMGEVSAHYHPKARLVRRGQSITRRCFLTDHRRVILPAFGIYTGGLDARNSAFDPLFSGGATALMLGTAVTPVRRDRLG